MFQVTRSTFHTQDLSRFRGVESNVWLTQTDGQWKRLALLNGTLMCLLNNCICTWCRRCHLKTSYTKNGCSRVERVLQGDRLVDVHSPDEVLICEEEGRLQVAKLQVRELHALGPVAKVDQLLAAWLALGPVGDLERKEQRLHLQKNRALNPLKPNGYYSTYYWVPELGTFGIFYLWAF